MKHNKIISPTNYAYKTSLDVQLGEIVQVDEHLQGIITGFEVISNIPQPEKIKEIVGQIKREDVINGLV
jgi:hypothetical protein